MKKHIATETLGVQSVPGVFSFMGGVNKMIKKSAVNSLPHSFGPTYMAKVLGISKSFAYKIVNSGEMQIYVIGKRKIIMKDDFVIWLERNKKMN